MVEYAYNASTGSYASSGTVVAGAGVTGGTQFDDPVGVAVDAKGDLFVTAPGNESVEEPSTTVPLVRTPRWGSTSLARE